MSFTAKRAQLATVLSTVDQVTGHEFRPSPLSAGDAYPLLGSVDRGDGDAFAATWRIILCLGGDEEPAQDLLDAVLPDLVDLVDPVAYVSAVRPFVINTSDGDLYAAEITCLSE